MEMNQTMQQEMHTEDSKKTNNGNKKILWIGIVSVALVFLAILVILINRVTLVKRVYAPVENFLTSKDSYWEDNFGISKLLEDTCQADVKTQMTTTVFMQDFSTLSDQTVLFDLNKMEFSMQSSFLNLYGSLGRSKLMCNIPVLSDCVYLLQGKAGMDANNSFYANGSGQLKTDLKDMCSQISPLKMAFSIKIKKLGKESLICNKEEAACDVYEVKIPKKVAVNLLESLQSRAGNNRVSEKDAQIDETENRKAQDSEGDFLALLIEKTKEGSEYPLKITEYCRGDSLYRLGIEVDASEKGEDPDLVYDLKMDGGSFLYENFLQTITVKTDQGNEKIQVARTGDENDTSKKTGMAVTLNDGTCVKAVLEYDKDSKDFLAGLTLKDEKEIPLFKIEGIVTDVKWGEEISLSTAPQNSSNLLGSFESSSDITIHKATQKIQPLSGPVQDLSENDFVNKLYDILMSAMK